MDLFLTWTSSYTPKNPHQSTENLHTPTSMSATIPVPPLPPKTVSSDPLQDELTSYNAPPTLTKRTGHSLHNLLTKWTPPERVKRIMDSVKQKLENPNKLTLKQFNRQLKATTPSSTASFPYHHQKDQEIPSIPRRQSHKFIRDYPSGPTHQNEDHTTSSPHSQRHLWNFL